LEPHKSLFFLLWLLIYQLLAHHFENKSLLEYALCFSPFIDSAIAKFLSITRINTSEGEVTYKVGSAEFTFYD